MTNHSEFRPYWSIVAWLGLMLAPFFLVKSYLTTYVITTNFMQGTELVIVSACIPFLLLFELAALVLVRQTLREITIQAAKMAKVLGWFFSFGNFLAVFLYFCVVCFSWYFFSIRGIFPSIQEISSTVGTVDFQAMIFMLAQSDDAFTMAFGIFLVSILTLAFLRLTDRRLTRIGTNRLIIDSIVMFSLPSIIGLYLRFSIPENGRESLAAQVRTVLSPSQSLWWGSLIFGDNRNYFEGIRLAPRPRTRLASWVQSQRPDATKPNIMLLFVEALRSDVLFRVEKGIEITPFLNSIARENLWFQNAYSNAPETSYAQSTLLTGLHPLKFPWKDLNVAIDYPTVTIFDLLSLAGYRTSYLTEEWNITRRISTSARIGLHYDPKYDPVSKISKYFSKERISKVRRFPKPSYEIDLHNQQIFEGWVDEKPEHPFIFVQYLASTHFPYQWFPEMGVPIFEPTDPKLPVSFFYYPVEMRNYLWLSYLNTARWLDDLIRAYFEHLQDEGLLDNTVIIVTGDHGEMFHEHGQVTHGGFLFEEAIRVPLVIKLPKNSAYKKRCSEPFAVSHLDVLPTILDLAGFEAYPGFQGGSVVSSRDMTDSCAHRPIFITNQVTIFEDAIIEWPWKLVVGNRSGKRRLFNIENDPQESQDLSSLKGETAQKLESVLSEFRSQQFTYYMGEKSWRINNHPPALK